MDESLTRRHITRARAQKEVEAARRTGDEPYVAPLRRGTLELGYYAPLGVDEQTPHDQDEVYVVMTGSGTFVNGAQRHDFGPGDAIFVPAGATHRFEDFTDDTEVWVIFYGPEGGEEP